MEKEITEATTQNIDQFFGKLTEAADIVTKKLIDVAPEAAEAILKIVQFKGAFNLCSASILSVAGAVLALGAYRSFARAAKITAEGGSDYMANREVGAGILGVLLTVASAITIIMGAASFFDFYNWLSAFYPEGAIAMSALASVGIEL